MTDRICRHKELAKIYEQLRNYTEANYHLWMAMKVAEMCLGKDHEQTKKVEAAHEAILLKS